MKLEELYPWWEDSHQELVEAVELLREWQLDTDPGPSGRSLRQILLGFLRAERYWIAHLAAGHAEYRPQEDDFPDAKSLAEALRASRQLSRRVLEPLGPDGLRAVRTVPGDPGDEPVRDQPAHRLAVLARPGTGDDPARPGDAAFGRREGTGVGAMEPVVIADYDPQWPVLFEEIAGRVRSAFADGPLLSPLSTSAVRLCRGWPRSPSLT